MKHFIQLILTGLTISLWCNYLQSGVGIEKSWLVLLPIVFTLGTLFFVISCILNEENIK